MKINRRTFFKKAGLFAGAVVAGKVVADIPQDKEILNPYSDESLLRYSESPISTIEIGPFTVCGGGGAGGGDIQCINIKGIGVNDMISGGDLLKAINKPVS